MICCNNRNGLPLRTARQDLAPPPVSKVASPDRFLSVALSKTECLTLSTPIPEPIKATLPRSNSSSTYHNSFDPKPRIMPITAPIVAESELPPELARARLRGVLVKSDSDGVLNLPPINVFTPYSVNLDLPSRADESPSSRPPSEQQAPSLYEPRGSPMHYKPNNVLQIPQGMVSQRPGENQPCLLTPSSTAWPSDAEPFPHMPTPGSAIPSVVPGVPVPELEPSGRGSVASTAYSSPPHSPRTAAGEKPQHLVVEMQPVHQMRQQQQMQQPVQPIKSLGPVPGGLPSSSPTEMTSPYTILPERVSTAGPPVSTGRVGKQPVRDPEKLKHRIWLQQNRMHQDKLHQLGFRIQEGVNGSKICSLCQMAFSKEMFVWRHAWQHVNEKPFHCTVCRQKFTRSDTLQRHVRRTGHHLNPGS